MVGALVCTQIRKGKFLRAHQTHVIKKRSHKKVKYEDIHLIYFSCNKYGNNKENCPMRPADGGEEAVSPSHGFKSSSGPCSLDSHPFSIKQMNFWMVVKNL